MGAASSDFLIIQRVLPHYRIPLFEELHSRMGVRVVVAEVPPGGTFLNLSDPRAHEFAIPVPMTFPNPANAFEAKVPLDLILKEFKPRAVVAEFGVRMSTTRALPAARRRGHLSSFAFWSHGWQMERGFNSPTDILVQHYRLMLMRRADALGAYSEEGGAWLRRKLPGMPVVTLGNALDPAGIKQASASASATRSGSPQLLAVGRLTPDKRIEALIAIYREVRVSWPEAALMIIGDGPDRQRLEAIATSDGACGITFTGALHREEDLAPHFGGADFLVIPGAAGLSVNHALAYQLPVVAFARQPGGPRHHPEIEYVVEGRSGILVNSPDDSAMARRISEALKTGEQHRLRRALADRSPAPTVQEVAARFEELLGVLHKVALGKQSVGGVIDESAR